MKVKQIILTLWTVVTVQILSFLWAPLSQGQTLSPFTSNGNNKVVVSDSSKAADANLGLNDTATLEKTIYYPRRIPNSSFRVGEKLTFLIRWGPLHAGTAVMEIPEITRVQNRKVYRVVSRAESNSFFSTFYKVRDRAESFIDIEGIFSWRFEKHLREGKFKADVIEIYDQKRNLVITRKDTVQAPPFVQDVLSALYYVRTQDLIVGTSIAVDNYASGKIYPLEVKVLRRERVKVPAGVFDCIVVKPILKSTGIFQQKGSLKVWLTDDRRRMPVLMKSEIVIGSIVAELTDYKGVVTD
ncbi:DUF3108 domain-containing protein [candidate division KSB1 bacterium]|nr:MAG: DUF3108 domain-containing protein [candidate division KSB1 bacterium]